MPPSIAANEQAVLEQIAREGGLYPWEAFDFVERGTVYTIQKLHGVDGVSSAPRHVSGAELCRGLGEFAKRRWGFLAHTVLRRWNINSTLDFGRIVFTMIEHRLMLQGDRDSLDDFRDIYDLKAELESGYRIESLT